jgi:hypothetical protein
MKGTVMTLTTEDLRAIKSTVSDTINETMQPMIDASVEKFANIVGEGFNEITERFNQIDERFDHMEADLHEVKWSLSDTVRRAEFLDVRNRVVHLEHGNNTEI